LGRLTKTWEVPRAMQKEEQNKSVEATLYFLHYCEGKPVIEMSDTHFQANIRTGEFRDTPVTMNDARRLAERPELDRQGFELGHFKTGVSDFYNDDQITGLYYSEIEAFLKSATGATSVHIFDHTIRVQDDDKRAEKHVRLPVAPIHNDYTEWSGPKRVKDVMTEAEAERYLGHRFAMVNVWRSIGASAERLPLAMADARTVQPEDFVASDLLYNNRKGEIFQLRHSEGQDWFYFPDMQPDEVVLLKCFDNDTDGPARYTGHGAFENPLAEPHVPPRESIEVRTMISFAPPA